MEKEGTSKINASLGERGLRASTEIHRLVNLYSSEPKILERELELVTKKLMSECFAEGYHHAVYTAMWEDDGTNSDSEIVDSSTKKK